jgi:hypothetical protein
MTVRFLGTKQSDVIKHVTAYCKPDGSPISTYAIKNKHKFLICQVPGFEPHFGVFNAGSKTVRKGEIIGVYIGAVMQENESEESDYRVRLDFSLNDRQVMMAVDAALYRGWAGYINSFATESKANVKYGLSQKTFKNLDEMCYHIWIEAQCDIQPGDQLGTYYGSEFVMPSDEMVEKKLENASELFATASKFLS